MSTVADFVALVTDGRPIDGHQDGGRKKRFLSLGQKVLGELAEELGVAARIRAVPGRVEATGDIYFEADEWMVVVPHRTPRGGWGDFYAQRREPGSARWSGNQWFWWEDLMDLPALAARIRSMAASNGPIVAKPAPALAVEEVDPFS